MRAGCPLHLPLTPGGLLHGIAQLSIRITLLHLTVDLLDKVGPLGETRLTITRLRLTLHSLTRRHYT